MPTAHRLPCVLVTALLPLGCFFEPSPAAPSGDEDASSSSSGEAPGSSDGADGSSDAEGPSSTASVDDGSSTGGPALDDTPPTVVEVSPAPGAVGVEAEASIVLTFSEPMDPVATQAAWQSADIGPVAMAWDEDHRVLTLQPAEPLEYATGPSVAETEALSYALMLDTIATDAAGNALEEPFASSFTTLRRVVQLLPAEDALTGQAGPNFGFGDTMRVGDNGIDNVQRAAMTFTLPPWPPSLTVVESATVFLDQAAVEGSPYGPAPGLGQIHIVDLSFETLSVAADAADAVTLGVLSADDALETKSFEVTAAVIADQRRGDSFTQYLLEFDELTDLDAEADRATFDEGTAVLELVYLAE